MIRRAALALACCACACADPQLDVLLPALPPGADLVAVLFTADGGRILAATGLLPIGGPSTLPDDVDEAEVRGAIAIAYDATSLAPGLRPDAVTLSSSRLSPAAIGDRRLPPPSWSARAERDDDRFPLVESSDEVPALTAAWLARCPLVLPTGRGLVDFACKESPCRATVTQEGCALNIDAESCTYGQSRLTVDGEGRATVSGPSQLGECAPTSEGPEGSTLGITCDLQSGRSCAIDVYPEPGPPPFEVRSFVLGPTIDRGELGRPPVGLLPAVVAVGAHVVTTTLSAVTSGRDCDGAFARLVLLRSDGTGAPEYRPAPRCLVHLVRDGDGTRTFAGAFRDPDWSLGRFDLDGLVSARPLGLEPSARVVALDVDPPSAASPEIAVLVSGDPDRVLFVDAATFEVRRTVRLPPIDPRSVRLRSGSAGIAEDGDDAIYVIGRSDGSIAPTTIRGNNREEGVAMLRARGSSWIVTTTSRFGGVKVLAPGNAAPLVARPYEGFLQPYGMLDWPEDPALLLVGLTDIFDDRGVGDRTSKNAYLALLDPAGPRFLPGIVPVGIGPIEHMVADADGNVWATLPWATTLLRVSAGRL